MTAPDSGLAGMHGTRCVVFGGSGFMGTHIVSRLLAEGASVLAVDLAECLVPGAECILGDITDPTVVGSAVAGAEHIFCFAGGLGAVRSLEDPVRDLQTSVGAQVVLLEAVRHLAPDASVVFAGSRLEYGVPEYLPLDERHPLKPTSPYAAHKALCSWYYAHYAETYGLSTTVLRLPNPYGPHLAGAPEKDGYTILNRFIDTAKRGEPIRLFGDGSQTRDFVHVDDVVNAALAASVTPAAAGIALNIGSGVATSLRAAAELVVGLCGSGVIEADQPWPTDAAAIETGGYSYDVSLAREALGWQADVALRDGLAAMLAR
ncbi:MAG: NAD-dependent epimerase/dehydratase family protein [Actinobacteria bacterium]|nr:NAD-dependent epimerase/dehydratase family protein [Actinomycetota bacterium]